MDSATLSSLMSPEILFRAVTEIEAQVNSLATDELKLNELDRLQRLISGIAQKLAAIAPFLQRPDFSLVDDTTVCNEGETMNESRIIGIICGHIGNVVIDAHGVLSLSNINFPELVDQREELFESLTNQLHLGAPLRTQNGEVTTLGDPVDSSDVKKISSVLSRRTNGELWIEPISMPESGKSPQ